MLVVRPILFLIVFASGIVTVCAAALMLFVLLTASGSPGEISGACRNTSLDLESPESPGLRDVVTDPALALTWQERWDAFRSGVDAGQGTRISFEESEMTSRAAKYIADEDIPLKHITICFYDREAEARATAEIPGVRDIPVLGGVFDTEVRARGRIDLSGEHPRIDITSLEAGRLPGFASGLVEGDFESLINSRLAELTLSRSYDVAFREARADISVK